MCVLCMCVCVWCVCACVRACGVRIDNMLHRVLRQQKKSTRATMEAQESAFWFSQKPPVSQL